MFSCRQTEFFAVDHMQNIPTVLTCKEPDVFERCRVSFVFSLLVRLMQKKQAGNRREQGDVRLPCWVSVSASSLLFQLWLRLFSHSEMLYAVIWTVQSKQKLHCPPQSRETGTSRSPVNYRTIYKTTTTQQSRQVWPFCRTWVWLQCYSRCVLPNY